MVLDDQIGRKNYKILFCLLLTSKISNKGIFRLHNLDYLKILTCQINSELENISEITISCPTTNRKSLFYDFSPQDRVPLKRVKSFQNVLELETAASAYFDTAKETKIPKNSH